MKIIPRSLGLLTALLFLPLALFSNDLNTYRATYEQKVNVITETFAGKMALLDIQYEKGVNGLRPAFQKEGNLAKVKAVLAELERFQKENAVPEQAVPGGLEEIRRMQVIYSEQALLLKVERAESIVTLSEQFDRALVQLQKALVQDGKIDEAVTVQEERQRVEQSEIFLASKGIVEASKSRIVAAPIKKPVSPVRGHPPDAKRFGDHWYKVFTGYMPWDQAKKRCEEMGGYLACVETAKERQFLANRANGKVLWLGGGDAKQEGRPVWLNGKRVVLRLVDNTPIRDYIAFNRGGTLSCRRMSGEEQDFPQKKTQGFICEWNR